MRPLTPSQRVRRWSAYLWIWRAHRWLGLGLGAIIVLLSITGGLLVMHHELERWLHPDRYTVAAPASPAARASVDSVLQALQPMAPEGYRPLRLEPGHESHETDKYIFVGLDRVSRWSAL